MQILKPKFDSHEASFDSQTRTSTRVPTARFTRETMQSKHAVLNVFLARCESKGKYAFYFKTGLLKPCTTLHNLASNFRLNHVAFQLFLVQWSYLTTWLLTLQLFKNSTDTQEKHRLNLHSLSVSELLEYGRKSKDFQSFFCLFFKDLWE
jgi:hypothetical protein